MHPTYFYINVSHKFSPIIERAFFFSFPMGKKEKKKEVIFGSRVM